MAVEHVLDSPLAQAVRQAGGQSAFARIIGRKQSTVFSWLVRNHPLPAELVLEVEKRTGVSRHDLRPGVFPAEDTTVIAVGHGRLTSDRAIISDGRKA
ncbi:YdaS family helix-turn-helix protein [Sphingomonas sp. Mn802worker]|uniref:YdaS family helix-turn-helix protein n=1 Tax=Sphingomonas sp. Mn802worker TaxID=629773 RepID=UPI0009FD813B